MSRRESRPCDRLEKFTKVAATTILPSGHELPPLGRTYIMPSSGIWMPLPEVLLQKPNQPEFHARQSVALAAIGDVSRDRFTAGNCRAVRASVEFGSDTPGHRSGRALVRERAEALDSIDILEVALIVSKKYGVQLRADSQENHKIFRSLRHLADYIATQRTK